MATNYIWDFATDSYLMEKDDNGVTTAVYTNEPVQYGRLISQRRGSETSYYHFDGQGSTRQLTDHNGDVTDEYTYSAFGESVASAEATVNAFRFIGREGYYCDPNLHTYYVREREYDVFLARWLSIDPIGFDGRDAVLYLYCTANPLNYSDPAGMTPFPMPHFYCPRLPGGPFPPLLPPIYSPPSAGPKPPKPQENSKVDPTQAPPHWDPKYQDARPPGKCTQSRWKELDTKARGACKYGVTKNCSWVWSCTSLSDMEKSWRDCAKARGDLMNECFGGGNQTHRDQEWTARLKAWECEKLWIKWCWEPPPGPMMACCPAANSLSVHS